MIHFVIPAYDEAPNIEPLFARLRPVATAYRARIIVVDDGSSDGTASLVRQHAEGLNLVLIQHGENRGLGAAMRTGLLGALEGAADDDAIVTIESDTTSDLADLPTMLEHFERGTDVVLASVHAPGGRIVGVAPWRILASKAISAIVRIVCGLREIHTVSAVYRVYRASALRRAVLQYGDDLIRENGFAVNVELLLKLDAGGATLSEVPTVNDWTMRGGESKLQTGQTIRAYGRVMAQHMSRRLHEPAMVPVGVDSR